MDEDFWSEKDVACLHQQVENELQSLFNHDAEASHALLLEWLTDNPHFSPDLISHEGPFSMALRVHYSLVERGDHLSVEYLEWRKSYNDIWHERCNPKLTPKQEALLRSRGWNRNERTDFASEKPE